jgi:hypothetical protein
MGKPASLDHGIKKAQTIVLTDEQIDVIYSIRNRIADQIGGIAIPVSSVIKQAIDIGLAVIAKKNGIEK